MAAFCWRGLGGPWWRTLPHSSGETRRFRRRLPEIVTWAGWTGGRRGGRAHPARRASPAAPLTARTLQESARFYGADSWGTVRLLPPATGTAASGARDPGPRDPVIRRRPAAPGVRATGVESSPGRHHQTNDPSRTHPRRPPDGGHGRRARGHVPRGHRDDRRGGGHADGRRPARRAGLVQLGLLRLPAGVDGLDSVVGQALRPVRTPALLSLVHRHLPAGLRPLGGGHHHGRAHRVPDAAGVRRRRPHAPGDEHHRRPLHPGRAWPDAGAAERGVGSRLRGGAPRRGLHHRPALVALGVLPEHSVRRPRRAGGGRRPA